MPYCLLPLALFVRCLFACFLRWVRDKTDGQRIHTVAGIFSRLSLAGEDVAEVSVAIGTNDFGAPHTERTIGVANDGPGYFVVERWPAATAIEFIGGAIERRIATAANKSTRCMVIVIFPRKCPFGPFMDNDFFLFGREGIPVFAIILHDGETCDE